MSFFLLKNIKKYLTCLPCNDITYLTNEGGGEKMKSITVKVSDEGLRKLDSLAKSLNSGRSSAFRFILDRFSGQKIDLFLGSEDKKNGNDNSV